MGDGKKTDIKDIEKVLRKIMGGFESSLVQMQADLQRIETKVDANTDSLRALDGRVRGVEDKVDAHHAEETNRSLAADLAYENLRPGALRSEPATNSIVGTSHKVRHQASYEPLFEVD